MRSWSYRPAIGSLLLVAFAGGCRGREPQHEQQDEPRPPTNRIAVPEAVRRNLGIEFVKVERRRVASTLRIPGHFELLPAARREHRTPLAGRVEILVAPLQPVKAGDLLYRLDSPDWRRLQRELGELVTGVEVTRSKLECMQPLLVAHRSHEERLNEAVQVLGQRVERLHKTRAELGGHAAELSDAELQLAQTRASQAEAREQSAQGEATIAELRATLQAGTERIGLALSAAAAALGVDRDQLAGSKESGGVPGWRSIGRVEARATAGGIVDALPIATGGWADVGALVVTTVDVRQVRFRARGLQSDLWRLRPDLPARVVAPQGGAGIQEAIPGALAFGVEADPQQRTIDLFLAPAAAPADWGRAGVAAFLEVETASGGEAELAVPLSCVLTDGLQRVLFLRDPKDKDQVIRVEADVGVSDGRWVEIKSGLAEGDQVVLGGAYELMLASSDQAAKGGHFHADGTFHAGEHK